MAKQIAKSHSECVKAYAKEQLMTEHEPGPSRDVETLSFDTTPSNTSARKPRSGMGSNKWLH